MENLRLRFARRGDRPLLMITFAWILVSWFRQ